jgi:hypothetical protein
VSRAEERYDPARTCESKIDEGKLRDIEKWREVEHEVLTG